MKALAILCALANLGAVGFAAFLMWFVAVFPWENTTPEEAAADDWLVPTAVVLAAAGTGLLVSVAMSWPGWATMALGLQTAVGVGVLGVALGESDHSDGKLIGYALGVELAAASAVWLLRQHVAAPAPAAG